MGRGWEYVIEKDLPGHAQQWGEDANQRLSAKPVDVGRYDVCSERAWLTTVLPARRSASAK